MNYNEHYHNQAPLIKHTECLRSLISHIITEKKLNIRLKASEYLAAEKENPSAVLRYRPGGENTIPD